MAALKMKYGRSEGRRLVGLGRKDHGTSVWLLGMLHLKPTIVLREGEETSPAQTLYMQITKLPEICLHSPEIL